MKKVFITGVTGFAGSFLAECLLKLSSYEISGTYLDDYSLRFLENKEKLQLFQVNLLDSKKISDLIEKIKPDYIYHLAALTSPKDSFANPADTMINNISAQINLLEAIKNQKLFQTKILIVSSGDIYGLVDEKDLPIDEQTPLMPINPYSVSKIAQDFLGLQYFLSYKLQIIRVRPFNHIGPKQSPNFVISSFAKKIAEIEKNSDLSVLKVGNLEAKRDFTDVRDMVRAYQLVLEHGELGDVYNIGSGKSYKIAEIVEKFLKLSEKKISVEKDLSLFRPVDEPELRCNPSKFIQLTNWKQTISLDQTLKDTLDYWRNFV